MKVAKLIEILKKMPPNEEVKIGGYVVAGCRALGRNVVRDIDIVGVDERSLQHTSLMPVKDYYYARTRGNRRTRDKVTGELTP